ncbi:MAG: heme-copper oxidase subunit III [Chloroflexota bacterium]
MTHTTATHPTPTWEGIKTVKFAMWLFLASEIMFFTGLIVAYIALRYSTPNWPVVRDILNVPLVALNTFILIISSVTMVTAYDRVEHGDHKGFPNFLLATAVLGLIFLSIQAIEWTALMGEGVLPATSIFGATFFTLTGFHGLHVTGGVIWVLWATRKAFRGGYHHDHLGVELVGLYWHFVDLVWIILFTIIYLI